MKLLQGHVLDVLATMPEARVQCVVTSPPYIGVELLPKYHRIAERRLTVSVEGPLFTEPAP